MQFPSSSTPGIHDICTFIFLVLILSPDEIPAPTVSDLHLELNSVLNYIWVHLKNLIIMKKFFKFLKNFFKLSNLIQKVNL